MLNRPSELLNTKLQQMEHLVLSIPAEQSHLVAVWTEKLGLYAASSMSFAESSPSTSMPHPPRRFRMSREEVISELVATLTAARAVTDASDSEGLKLLLGAVNFVQSRLYQTFLYLHEHNSPELFQLIFDKLSTNLQDRFTNEHTPAEIGSTNLELLKQFIKTLIYDLS